MSISINTLPPNNLQSPSILKTAEMLTSTILSILVLALATLTLSFPAPAPILAELAPALIDVDWSSIPDIPSPNNLAEYNAAVATFRAAMKDTAIDNAIFGPDATTANRDIVHASEWLLQKCETSEYSPSTFSLIMAISILVKRGEAGEGCNYSDRNQVCVLMQRWGEAGVGRCEPNAELRGRWLSCGLVASRVQTLLNVDGCIRTYASGTKRIGGVVSFQWSVFDSWTDLNVYFIADMVPGL